MSSIPPTMRASVLVKRGTLVVEERPVPAVDSDQVLVKVASVGVCGSDVHFYKEGSLGSWVLDKPLVLGHDSAFRLSRSVPPRPQGKR
jgi:L-iditol 2-dehydrogenase